jgi:hypothetical protein
MIVWLLDRHPVVTARSVAIIPQHVKATREDREHEAARDLLLLRFKPDCLRHLFTPGTASSIRALSIVVEAQKCIHSIAGVKPVNDLIL